MYATLQINNRNRLHMHGAPTASAFFHTTSFTIRTTRAAPLLLQAALTPAQASPAQLSANPPHSQASDAWKGLVFSLMASNRNAEAIDEIAKMPPDIRQQLEADIEFVQGEASVYISVGDLSRATGMSLAGLYHYFSTPGCCTTPKRTMRFIPCFSASTPAPI